MNKDEWGEFIYEETRNLLPLLMGILGIPRGQMTECEPIYFLVIYKVSCVHTTIRDLKGYTYRALRRALIAYQMKRYRYDLLTISMEEMYGQV
jgi:hypothetical protein